MAGGSLTVSQLQDLLETTEYKLGSPRFHQMIQKETFYEIGDRYVKKSAKDMHFGAGDAIKEFLQIKQTANLVDETDLFADDNIQIVNTMDTIEVPWKHRTTAIGWERRELLMNKGRARLINLMKTRRSKMLIDMIEKFEYEFFSAPLASGDRKIYGVPAWVLWNATEGFYGDDPANITTGAGGLSIATYPNWANYTRTYAAISEDDLLTEMIQTADDIGFRAPIDVEDMVVGSGKRQRFYTTQTVRRGIEVLGRQRNDNLGVEIARYRNQMVFQGTPILGLPILEHAADWSLPIPAAPVYCLNMDTFYPVFLEGDYIQQSSTRPHPGKHNVLVQFYDTTYNMICTNRRMNAVIATGTGSQAT